MLKIKVKIGNWKYCTQEAEFRVDIKYILPTVENNELHPLLQSPFIFLGCVLHSTWKWIEKEEKGRTASYALYADTLEKLIKKTKERIKKEIKTLKEIVRKNRKKIKEVEKMQEVKKTYLI